VPTEKLSENIYYVKNIRGEIVLTNLSTKLRNGGHAWLPYALNGRGGVLDSEPHMLIDFTVFHGETEMFTPILLLESVRDRREGRNKAAAQVFDQGRTIELAFLVYFK
jgi:hypothetical protein